MRSAKISENCGSKKESRKIASQKDADLASGTVVKMEAGESPNSNVDTLEKIAKALGVPTIELFN
ncbi:helix-turn-helix domain-containing protein [Patescibacteria group bacterium]|nr:helix-turn-helix domain-containing protein [Patescibacteria group bacterium]